MSRAWVAAAVFALFAGCSAARAANATTPAYAEAYQYAMECIRAGGDAADCFAKASPARCAAQAVGMVTNRDLWQRNWMMCVQSCSKAGLWGRTVGDCRR